MLAPDAEAAVTADGKQPTSGRGYIGARTDTTRQSGQTPDEAVDINHITVYVNGHTAMWNVI
jgi:hypothetical protein